MWPRPRPFRGNLFTLGVGLGVVDPFVKSKERSLIHSRNIEGGLTFQNEHVTQIMPLSGVNFFTLGVGLAVVDPLAKFKV